MAAAAVVLLASHFEEYVRQQVEEYAKGMMTEYAHLPNDVREKLVDTYWRAGSGRLSRIRPSGNPLWASTAEPLLRALVGYPVGNDVGSFIANVICEHDNNMRWDTITEMTGRVGIKKLADLMFKSAKLKAKLNINSKGQFASELKQQLNQFYSLRNGIAAFIHEAADEDWRV
jgi:hypothetical protein